jgi:hypothetical protein
MNKGKTTGRDITRATQRSLDRVRVLPTIRECPLRLERSRQR